MSEFSLFGELDQVSGSEAGKVFRVFIRGHVRDLICRVMAQEVSLLCDPKHLPTGGEKFRSGSSTGRIQIDGKREELIRPRVRQRTSEVCSEEVILRTSNTSARRVKNNTSARREYKCQAR